MEIRFRTTKRGIRAFYYMGRPMHRWFPIPVAEARFLIATGKAEEVK